MFVWNHFTNDARVLRECTALSENLYDVDLICIDDPNDPKVQKYEKINPHFRVHRVRRYPLILEVIQGVLRRMVKNKYLALVSLAALLVTGYLFPILTISVLLLGALVLFTKLKTILIRLSILMRMIHMGRRENYDIYHSNDLNTLLQGYVSAKLKFKKKKLIYDSHEVQTSRTGYDSKFYGIYERFLIRYIDAMIVENNTRALHNEEIYGFYPYVVHNYPFKNKYTKDIDRKYIHKVLELHENEKVLLYQGGIQTGRGLENLVKAMPFIKEGTLVFIGDGRIKNDLETLVEKLDLGEKIKFIPKVPLHELPKYTNSAYLGFQVLNNVCFNHYSASSNKLFEYIMSNVPVVACDFPEIKKVVESANIGICVDSHDERSIAVGVNYLIANEVERHQMSSNCIEASNIYNWENEKKHLLLCYEDIDSRLYNGKEVNREVS